MSLITCAEDCEYQKEGYCCLEECSAVTNSGGGCPHYLKNGNKAGQPELKLPGGSFEG